MRSRRSPSKSKQLEDSVQTSASQQMSGTMGNQAALQSMGMGGASPQSAIPVGADSPSGMTGAPDQAQKKGPMAKRKQRKAQQADYNAAVAKETVRHGAWKEQTAQELAQRPDSELKDELQEHLYSDRTNGTVDVRSQLRFSNSERYISGIATSRYAQNLYAGGVDSSARDSVSMVRSLNQGEDDGFIPEDKLHQYLQDEGVVQSNVMITGRTMEERQRRDATQEEVSEAYGRLVEFYPKEALDVWGYVTARPKVFNNSQMTPANLVEYVSEQTPVFYKIQELKFGLGRLIEHSEFKSLSPEIQAELYQWHIRMSAIKELLHLWTFALNDLEKYDVGAKEQRVKDLSTITLDVQLKKAQKEYEY